MVALEEHNKYHKVAIEHLRNGCSITTRVKRSKLQQSISITDGTELIWA